MFSYLAYGLGIRSTLTLPELVSGNDKVDVEIRLGDLNRPSSEPTTERSSARITEDEARFFWDDVGSVLVKGGREIILEPAPGVDERVLRLFILGPALAILLYQRGFLVLHASAVALSGSAIATLGWSGWGKSTVAGILHDRGHTLVADDVLAVDLKTPDCPIVAPGFPRLKLWPDSAVAIGRDPEAMPRLHPKLEKRAHSVHQGFVSTPLPLKQIYVLAEGQQLAIERLGLQEALVELIRHTYRVQLIKDIWPPSHLQQYAALVNAVPVCRLTAPRDLRLLPDLARLVEEDALRH